MAANAMPRDPNDILREDGPAALRLAVDNAHTGDLEMPLDPDRGLKVGSHNEVAQRVVEDLTTRFTEVVFSEGDLWFWNGLHWEGLSQTKLLPFMQKFDGQPYYTEVSNKPSLFKLNKSAREGIEQFVTISLTQEDFFHTKTHGISVRNGYIIFEDGVPKLVPHTRSHKQRHILEVDWDGSMFDHPPEGSLLHGLIEGCFRGDPDANEKALCLAEVAASALLGIATHLTSPKAAVLYGPSAGNGKSQFLALFRSILPKTATTTLTAQQLGDDRFRATLPGILLNTADELGTAAIKSDTFKGAITGEQTAARQVYKTPINFNPVAQHVFATNTLPPFSDGMDAGVLRRLMIIPFNRTIPENERIANLAQRIAQNEAEIFLSWVIAGAVRLLRQGAFTEVPSAEGVLKEWVSVSDPVMAWLSDKDVVTITGKASDHVHVREAHKHFQQWGRDVGLSVSDLPWQPIFTQRLKRHDDKRIGVKHGKNGNNLMGVVLKPLPVGR